MKKLIALAALACAAFAHAQTAPVDVAGAWARASVPGQSGTGAFMTLTARQRLQLVGVTSPVAGVAEVHEMKLEGDVMRMRALPALPLAAGQPVELKPGGYHLMLMELKQPLVAGSEIPLTLQFRDASGAGSQLELSVPVRSMAPGHGPGAPHGHGGKH